MQTEASQSPSVLSIPLLLPAGPQGTLKSLKRICAHSGWAQQKGEPGTTLISQAPVGHTLCPIVPEALRDSGGGLKEGGLGQKTRRKNTVCHGEEVCAICVRQSRAQWGH